MKMKAGSYYHSRAWAIGCVRLHSARPDSPIYPYWLRPDWGRNRNPNSGTRMTVPPGGPSWVMAPARLGAMAGWGISISYKLVNDALVKQSFTDALVDTNISARADVLWDADESVLYVLMYSGTTARFSKDDYTPGTQTYTRQTGYPRTINLLPGSESATMTKDSEGTLWIVYDPERPGPVTCLDGEGLPEETPDGEVRVLWSTDHLTWTEQLLYGPVCGDDLATIVAFDNKIGVMWSDQTGSGSQQRDNLGFQIHIDTNAPNVWEAIEEVPMPPSHLFADDHLNFKVTDAGDILVAIKTSTTADGTVDGTSLNETELLVRWHDTGTWSEPFFVTGDSSRPIVVFDRANQDVYVFYTGVFASTPRQRNISYKVASLEDLANPLILDPFVAPAYAFMVLPVVPPDVTGNLKYSLNNPTSTKQAVDQSRASSSWPRMS